MPLPKNKCSNFWYALFGSGTTCITSPDSVVENMTLQVQIPHPTQGKFQFPSTHKQIRIKGNLHSSNKLKFVETHGNNISVSDKTGFDYRLFSLLNFPGRHLGFHDVIRLLNPPYGKRWRLYILPQYLANLTQPIGTLKVIFFTKFFLVLIVLCMLDLKFSKVFCAFL